MLNRSCIIGRLTDNPELRTTQAGKRVCSFCIANDRGYGEHKTTNFINIVAWESKADFVTKYFHKGEMIAIDGSISTRNYEDKNGNKRTVTEIIADDISFCGNKNNDNTSVSVDDWNSADDNTDDDLPF